MSERNLQYYVDQIMVARTEIKNLRQKLSSMKQEHQKEMESVKSALNSMKCADCSQRATTSAPVSPQTPPTSKEKQFQPIGVIETSFQNKRAVPRQPTVLKHSQGVVVIDTNVFNNPEHALEGLDEFSHMWYNI